MIKTEDEEVEQIDDNYCEWCRKYEKNRLKCKAVKNLINGE